MIYRLGMDAIPVTGVSELVLEVVDLERAERFYSVILGFPVVDRWPDRDVVWVMAGAAVESGTASWFCVSSTISPPPSSAVVVVR